VTGFWTLTANRRIRTDRHLNRWCRMD